MANHMIAPFYELSRRISFVVRYGDNVETVTGEVMDTDTGWIAVNDEANAEVRWYNLDHVIHITVLEHVAHE